MKIAISGNYATQFLLRPLKKAMAAFSDVVLYETDFNGTELAVVDDRSGLYHFAPQYLVWHESPLGMRDEFYRLSNQGKAGFAENRMKRLEGLLATLHGKLPGIRVLFPIPVVLNDCVYGNFYSKVPESWDYQATKFNWLLTELSEKTPDFYLVSTSSLARSEPITDWAQVVTSELHFTPAFLDRLASEIAGFIASFEGRFRKCLVMDLDNTLWGGIIGEDGMEGIQIGELGAGRAFVRLQQWIRQLQQRGVILAVCSKNDEQLAKQPFEEHPEMVLSLNDIAVFIANWESKADNINHIAQILNVGFDSMVFIDDSPVEREIVRKHIQGICVPELPADPAEFLPYLTGLNLFETASFSGNDEVRTRQYQEESKRAAHFTTGTNMDDFLQSLQMKASITRFTKIDFERIAQLTQRSNQFNLRTIRYTTDEVRQIAEDPRKFTLAVHLQDKFGNYGLTGLMIITLSGNKEAFIDTWVMSCRVLKRTVEQLMLNVAVKQLLQAGIEVLRAEYLATPKNGLVAELLPVSGFTKTGRKQDYLLNLNDYKPQQTNITIS